MAFDSAHVMFLRATLAAVVALREAEVECAEADKKLKKVLRGLGLDVGT